MRLTLRTLLAYMDDILDPADHEALASKIEASDFAAELIHRSRDTVRRLRLGAPEVFAGEDDDVLNPDPASDANTVAEYLDNVLPPEHVAEFERVCLDSGTVADMHLAEVTSCHHILTMVLGEPAEIDPRVRRRMYELPQRVEGGDKLRIESAHQPIVAAPPAPVADPIVAASAEPAVAATTASAPVLPDYLRVAAEGRRRRNRLMVIGALFVIGCGAALLFFPGKAPEVPAEVAGIDADAMLDDLQIGTAPAAEPAPSTDATAPHLRAPHVTTPHADATMAEAGAATVDETAPATDDAQSASAGFDDSATTEDAATPEAAPGFGAAVGVVDEEPAPVTPAPSDTAPLADTSGEREPGEDIAQAEMPLDAPQANAPLITPDESLDFPAPTDEADPSVSAGSAGVPLPPQDFVEAPVELEPAELEEETTTGVIPGDPLGIEGTEATSDQAPPEPPGPVQVGVYFGNNDVLLRLVPDTAQWIRLPPRTALVAGDTVLALPKYRIHVLLGNVNTYLSGGTQITLPEQAPSADEGGARLSLEMQYGRMLLNAGPKGSDLALRIGGHNREFRLENSASLAVEVHRVFVPGTDYTQQAAPVEVNWYLTSGTLEWGSEGNVETIRAPAAWTSVNEVDEPARAVVEFPNWLDREPMTDLERRARDRFAEDIPIGQPVGLRLEELNSAAGAGREIRTLSAEASLYVGEFEPFVKSLNDSDQRSAWRSHISAMRQALAMDPLVAAKLRQTFINLRGQEAGEMLYQMVVGFTPEQIGTTREELKSGVVVDLVRALEHESLDFRVLAINNLDEIKGTKDLKDYRPDGIPRSRAVAITKIREMIENNEFLNLP